MAGVWTGSVDVGEKKAGEEEYAKDLVETLSESMQLTIELRDDGSYREQVLFYEVSGRWEKKGRNLVLTPETVNGAKVAEVADATLRDHVGAGKTFEIEAGGASFRRSQGEGGYSEVYRRKS